MVIQSICTLTTWSAVVCGGLIMLKLEEWQSVASMYKLRTYLSYYSYERAALLQPVLVCASNHK
jgi:hypothetical protein